MKRLLLSYQIEGEGCYQVSTRFAIDGPLPEQHQYIQLVDLYADKEPWEILEGTNTNASYFIILLKKEKPNHKRFK
ncbi:hypothetical protein RDI58_010590 [Solanum bulbocastanum]|uniref:Uncharacterized protein n=1 Tax=Solanum bulbocastanum TaxID=147425 RepID=A0AAN8TR79_SOLBU